MEPEGTREQIVESMTTLGALASGTSRIRLELLIPGVTYHHPLILAITPPALGEDILRQVAKLYDRDIRPLVHDRS